MKRLFWIIFALILAFAFLLRIIPPQNHNFFFTIDQADDAVWAREFFEKSRILLHGSQTNIPGVYAGPLWYYFISIGFFLFRGDPFGALFMVIALNVVFTGALIILTRKKIGNSKALALGFLLQFFWWFYDSSRWAFNPFPLVSLTIIGILLLAFFLEKKRPKYFFLASIPIFLNFNAEIAGASAVYLFYTLFGLWSWRNKRLKLRQFVLGVFGLPLILVAFVGFQLAKRLYQNHTIGDLPGESTGYFSGLNYGYLAGRFAELFSYAVVPYHTVISFVLFAIVFLVFLKQVKQNVFVKYYIFLSLGLYLTSFLLFGATRGWYDWHTVYLPTLLYIAFILLLLHIPKKVGISALVIILVFQINVFKERYLQYLSPQEGPGILSTQIKILDWVYQNSDNDGFNAYTYSPSVRDYPYQYLFWWYGRKQYGFVPCEYSIRVHDLKLYIPHKDDYSTPTLGCDKLRFLVIEPHFAKDNLFEEWFREVTIGTVFLEATDIDGVIIEKRRLKRQEEL